MIADYLRMIATAKYSDVKKAMASVNKCTEYHNATVREFNRVMHK
jgi:hypothetical protein